MKPNIPLVSYVVILRILYETEYNEEILYSLKHPFCYID